MAEKKDSTGVCFEWRERCPCPARWPKCLAGICAFVVCMCAVSFADAFFVGSISSSITTLETRYNLSLSKVALIGTVYNVGALAVQLFVVYFGGKRSRNRPQWIGVGLLFITIGTIIIFLPQFIYGEYDFYTHPTGNRCHLNNTDYEDCSTGEQNQNDDNSRAYIFLAVGAAVAGAAWTPVKPLGFSYIDDNTNSGNSAFYIGIINSMYGVGSIISFVASSFFIKLWVDFYRVDTDTIPLTSDDDDWAGAWWIGIIITGFIIFLSSLPFFSFPKQLLERPPKKKDEKQEDDSKTCGLPRSAWRLMRNLPFMTVNLGFVTTVAIVFGITSFIPKYFETQFGLSTATANLLTGLVPVPAFGLGQLVGGYLIKKIRAGITESAKVLFITSLVTLTGLLIMLGLGCSSGPIAGISTPYDQNSDSVTLNAECNAACSCPEVYDPVCGDDGVTFFSPCHAGCTDKAGQALESCSCINSEEADSSACSLTCNTLAPFVVLLFVVACTNSMEEVPQTMVTLRSVDEDDKAMAIGMREIFMRLLGMIPAPLLFGAAIDSSCTFWEYTCGDKGSCLIYSLEDFRLVFFGVLVALKTVSVLCNLICWRTLVFRQSKSKKEDEQKLAIESAPVKKKRVTWDKNSLALINYGFDETASTNGDVVKLSSKVVNDVNGAPNGIKHVKRKPVTPIWIDNVHVVTPVPKPDDIKVISEFKPIAEEPVPDDKNDPVQVVHTSAPPNSAKLKWLMPIQGSTTSLNNIGSDQDDESPSTSAESLRLHDVKKKTSSKLKWTIPDDDGKASIPTISRSVSEPSLGDSKKTKPAPVVYPLPAPRSVNRPTSSNHITARGDRRSHGSMGTLYDIKEHGGNITEPNGWATAPNGWATAPNEFVNLVAKPIQTTAPIYATVKKTNPANSYRRSKSQRDISYGVQPYHGESLYSTIGDDVNRHTVPDPDFFAENDRGKQPMGKRKPMEFTEIPRSLATKRLSLQGTTLPTTDSNKKPNGILKQNGFVTTKRRSSTPGSLQRDECPAAIYI